MAKSYPIQQSFSAGEITPLLAAQVEADIYKQGLRYCFNMVPDSHGPVQRRDGFIYVSDVAETQIPLKMMPFNASLEKDYVVIIGDNWLQVYDEDGPAFGGVGAQNLITNGHFLSGIIGWFENADHGSSNVSWNPDERVMDILSGGTNPNQFCGSYQNVALVNTTGVLHDITFDMRVNIQGTSTFELRIGTTINAFDILQQTIVGGLNQTFQFTPAAAVTDVWVEFYVVQGDGEISIDNVVMTDTTAPTVLLQFASPWAGVSGVEYIQFSMSPGGNPALYMAHHDVAPQVLVLTVATNTWDLFPVPFLNTPAEWGAGNWPRAVTFFHQRSWWGGLHTDPEKFWGSIVGDYIDMDLGTSLAGEGIAYEIAKRGDILYMSGAKNLVIGTENAEYLAVADSGILQPGDIETQQQSAYGTFLGVHEQSGDRVLYVSATGTKLRSMAYDWTKDTWISVDIAWPSEHLVRGIITQMSYQFDPAQVIWMITSGHHLISCSYNREQGIVGWAQHGSNDLSILGDEPAGVGVGTDESTVEFAGLTTSTVFGIDRLWTTIRYVDGVDATHVVLMRFNNACTMDAFIHFVAPSPTNIITGLEHLEGFVVDILVDGAVDVPQTVVGGQITTVTTGTEFFVGASNTAYIRTLPKEGGERAGTSQGAMKRDPYIFLRLYRSSLPIINGSRPADRTPATSMGTPEPMKTGDFKISNDGWNRSAPIDVSEPLPVRLNILGIFGKNASKQR